MDLHRLISMGGNERHGILFFYAGVPISSCFAGTREGRKLRLSYDAGSD